MQIATLRRQDQATTGHARGPVRGGACYIPAREGQVVETREYAGGAAFADYDAEGNLLGVEVLPSAGLTAEQLFEMVLNVVGALAHRLTGEVPVVGLLTPSGVLSIRPGGTVSWMTPERAEHDCAHPTAAEVGGAAFPPDPTAGATAGPDAESRSSR